MSTRQYIGARYVPKFYVNANDGSSLWQDNVIYEPLTWVTRPNFRMYISRQTVPATIGAPEDNIDYWLEVGQFNGYIQQLSDSITTLNNQMTEATGDISDLQSAMTTAQTTLQQLVEDVDAIPPTTNIWHNKKVVVYGDSLSANVTGFWAKLAEIDDTIEITNRAVSESTIDNTTTLLNSASDLTDFDIVAIGHGTNEWQHLFDETTLTNSFESAFSTVASKIAGSNTQVYVITPPYSYRDFGGVNTECNGVGFTIYDVNNIIAKVAKEYSYPVFNLYTMSSCNSTNYTSYLQNNGGIYVHPNDAFNSQIAKLLYSWNCVSYEYTPMVFGKNMLHTLEFVASTHSMTAQQYVTIPNKFKGGICALFAANSNNHTAYRRHLSSDCEYYLKLWSNLPVGIVITDGTNVVYQMIAGGYSREFKTRIHIPTTGDYNIYFNVTSETLVGGLCMCRADGQEEVTEWLTASVTGATEGSVSYQINDDEIVLSSSQLTVPANTQLKVTLLGMSGIPTGEGLFLMTAGAQSSPELCIGSYSGNVMTCTRTLASTTYFYTVPTKVKIKCYNFDFQY